ncbi:MAG: putative Tic20 family protein [Planctomycetota bacterium]|jgi:uncharacterized Tic20 family protein
MKEREEKRSILLCHMLGLFGYIVPIIGNVVLPYVLWKKKKGASELVDFHGKEALNYQITVSLGLIVLTAFSVSVFGFGVALLSLLNIANICFIIMATIKTSEGGRFKYPVSLRLIK